jgi:hypothetical protein
VPEQPTAETEDHPRVRFAKRELMKILVALERVDGDELNAGMRVLALEDELAETREEVRRWRQGQESMRTLLDQMAGANQEERVERLDQAIRGWVGKT